ncbi:MAG TPA: hypothetical protein VFI08_01100 [Spirochaetia bacterium]|nr:hypothetical protein [Spirochaetia bacterium]
MKAGVIVLLIGVCAAALPAEQVQYTRTLTSFGASVTVGDSTSLSNLGGGVLFKSMSFFDPSRPSGLYYGMLTSYFFHAAGGVTLADMKPVTVGYRGMLTPRIGVAVEISPTIGARIVRDTVEGNAYLGIGPSLGVFVPVSESIDLTLSYEPVLNLYTIDGSTATRNKSYSDIVLGITFKSYSQTQNLRWEQP